MMETRDQAKMSLEAQTVATTATINQTQLPEWKQETNRLRSEFNRLENFIDDKLEQFRVQIVGHFKLLLENGLGKSIDFSIEPRVNPSKGILGPTPVTKMIGDSGLVVNETKDATVIVETTGEPKKAFKVDTFVVKDVYDSKMFEKRFMIKEVNNPEWSNSIEVEQALLVIQAPISAVLNVDDKIQRVDTIPTKPYILQMEKDIVGLRQLSDSSFTSSMNQHLLCFKLSNSSNRSFLIQSVFRKIYSIRFMNVDRDFEFHDPYTFRLLFMSILQGFKNLSVNKEYTMANLFCWPICIVSTAKEVINNGSCYGVSVLAGCDFLPSVPGIRIVKAHSLVIKYRNLDHVLSVLKIKKGNQMPEDYSKSFKESVAVFQHARIYDVEIKQLKHRKPFTKQLLQYLDEGLDFLESEIPSLVASAIAEGKLVHTTMQTFHCDKLELINIRQTSYFTVFSSHKTREKRKGTMSMKQVTVSTESKYFQDTVMEKLTFPVRTRVELAFQDTALKVVEVQQKTSILQRLEDIIEGEKTHQVKVVAIPTGIEKDVQLTPKFFVGVVVLKRALGNVWSNHLKKNKPTNKQGRSNVVQGLLL